MLHATQHELKKLKTFSTRFFLILFMTNFWWYKLVHVGGLAYFKNIFENAARTCFSYVNKK